MERQKEQAAAVQKKELEAQQQVKRKGLLAQELEETAKNREQESRDLQEKEKSLGLYVYLLDTAGPVGTGEGTAALSGSGAGRSIPERERKEKEASFPGNPAGTETVRRMSERKRAEGTSGAGAGGAAEP